MVDRVELAAEVPEEMHGSRLDQAAAQIFQQYSRSRLQTWIKQGELTVDGQARQPRDKVTSGQNIVISATLNAEVAWKAQDIPLDLIFEDESILILNKPAGLVVHPAAGHAQGTLVNALLNHCSALEQLPRGGIVHRLDKDTSGIMVVAKTLESHNDLVAQLQARTVSRKYTAVCIGTLTGGGTVDAPMGRHPKQRKKMAVVPHGGKAAITHYRIARRFGHHTQIDVSLETGRTHQIRVHMAHRHNPLVGDPLYGGRPRIPKGASAELMDTLRSFPRQALHARELGLFHPESGEPCEFECALPADLVELIDILKAEDPGRG
jgi:23S rRNA pseudouridine1911/1915/1917 synthase